MPTPDLSSPAPTATSGAVDAIAALHAHGSGTLSIDALVRVLMRAAGAERGLLYWYERGHAQVHADVHADAPAPGGTAGRDDDHDALTAAAEEAIDQGVRLCWPDPLEGSSPWITLAHRRHAQAGDQRLLTIPLAGADHPLGALQLCWTTASPPGSCDDESLELMCRTITPILTLHRRAALPWQAHLREALERRLTRWMHPTTAGDKRLRTAAALTALCLILVPWPDRVGGQARIEGAQQRVLVSPTDGFIKSTHVLPGDRVKAQQVLVDLAEQDLKLERDKWLSQIAQQDNAYAAAMTRADRAEAAISLSRLEEAQAQLALVDEQLQRSQLKAPFDGVVIQGDLSQSIGAPVKQGDALVTVASTQSYRVIIDVDESDIARIQPGQEGVMALSALPWHTLDLKIHRITPQAQPKDGRNVYEVQASFLATPGAEVRPGLMGPAKIVVGYRPPLWSWIHPLIDRLRLLLWAWWG